MTTTVNPHTVTLKQLNEWIEQDGWSRFASSFNRVSRKTFDVSTSGQFRIMDHGAEIYLGGSEVEAIAAYNAAP